MNPVSKAAESALVGGLNSATLDPNTEVVIAPPSIYLLSVKASVRQDVAVSAQNLYPKDSGAFTGEISPKQLVDAGIPWVILGHSERRTLFNESSEFVAQKTRVAIDTGLKVILCIGETLQQREAGETNKINEAQLAPVIAALKPEDWKKVIIAYEPVWAIGTGKVATASQAQETQAAVRVFLSSAVSPVVAEETRIIYGGSVIAANCKELATQPDIDGFLVGGASLKPEFADIINSQRL